METKQKRGTLSRAFVYYLGLSTAGRQTAPQLCFLVEGNFLSRFREHCSLPDLRIFLKYIS